MVSIVKLWRNLLIVGILRFFRSDPEFRVIFVSDSGAICETVRQKLMREKLHQIAHRK